MPAQSSRSIGFLMLVGSSLTLCGILCNNKAMLSPGFLRYDPSKSNYGLLVTAPFPACGELGHKPVWELLKLPGGFH